MSWIPWRLPGWLTRTCRSQTVGRDGKALAGGPLGGWRSGVGIGLWLVLSCAIRSWGAEGVEGESFINFETAPVHPLELSPDGTRLAVCNLADGKVELFDVTSGMPVLAGVVAVGLDPVAVRFRNAAEVWVVNQISDSVSVVDLATLRVVATIDTLDTPADVVFAGEPVRAFVSCALPNTLQVFDPVTRLCVTNVAIDGERPKSLAVSPDGRRVYAAVFESGNGTTLVGAQFRGLLFFSNVVSLASGPYGGQVPPPNSDLSLQPPLNPALPADLAVPPSGLIVRKNNAGRWLDDNARDWTEFVSGTNAALTQRVPGWDLPDHDLAIVDTVDYSVVYAEGLMNLCMAAGVNPASGQVAVIGTDAINEVRFEPNLNGVFVRVRLALVDPLAVTRTVRDLNPHLDYTLPAIPADERDRSIGDPRGVVWTANGLRGYVAGMGSRNVAVIDAQGNRLGPQPIEVGEGPCGLALDEARHRLYVFNRFSSSLSVVDTLTEAVVGVVSLFDPTPLSTAAGRRHLYDTRRTSGLGQASCASCHVDARLDRLAWDLGDPAGELTSPVVNHQGTLVTNRYHPMKGVMVTQTLQDIIGHEPFHWRGDRADIEAFNPTFTRLQGAETELTAAEMGELRDFLASIRFPPNPYRLLDNSLSTNLPLPGFTALGENVLPAGAPLPNGNAVAGVGVFNHPANFCATCHTLPTGLGLDSADQAGVLQPVPPGPNGGRHFPLAFRLEGTLRSKISQFRNLADRVGMDGTRTASRAGFGFGHDGSVDSLTRFLNGVRVVPDQEVADLIALLLSVAGADLGSPGAVADTSPAAAVGRQLTLRTAERPPLLEAMLDLAQSPTSRVDLVVKGLQAGQARGWYYDRGRAMFQSDRGLETLSVEGLVALAGDGSELTFTVAARGTGRRLGIDRDLDGAFDRDELDAGTDPADVQLRPRILTASSTVAVGMDTLLTARLPPLPARGQMAWLKDGQPIAGATNTSWTITNTPFAAAGEYHVVVTTPFQVLRSEPLRLTVVPLLVTVTPAAQTVRRGSNAVFTAAVIGLGPFTYQWQFQNAALDGATEASLILSNVQVTQEGAYRVTANNASGVVTSAAAQLAVWVNPAVVVPPLSQRVVTGGDATFSVQVSGHPPPFGFQLTRASVPVNHYVSQEPIGFLRLSRVQSAQAGTYRILVTNAANPTPGLNLGPVTLTVLADSDGDGLPDEWELAYGLATNEVADARSDSDLDGLTNQEEYLAGTDPRDAQSFLRVEGISLAGGEGAVVVRFNARSNRTYTVQSSETPGGGSWSRTADVVAFPTNRLVAITNAMEGAAARYYRLASPTVP